MTLQYGFGNNGSSVVAQGGARGMGNGQTGDAAGRARPNRCSLQAVSVHSKAARNRQKASDSLQEFADDYRTTPQAMRRRRFALETKFRYNFY
jgi:hypothetical protein